MKHARRIVFGVAIAVLVLFLLSFLNAPSTTLHPGSTYSRAPHGYGAWYAYMHDRGARIQRWESPLSKFWHREKGTLVRVFPNRTTTVIDTDARKWVEAGNTLVQLGVFAPATTAEFTKFLDNPVGVVQIETARRLQQSGAQQTLLGDRFGAIVRQETMGQGRIVQVTTPYLAANAYQDVAGNYAFLAQTIAQPIAQTIVQTMENDAPIWVDEYLHGYRDKASLSERGEGDWIRYLAKTPLLAVALQGGILLAAIVWAQNQRFGLPQSVESAAADNSQAYIQALASVLARAGSSEFVTRNVGQSEKLRLQQKLGLGKQLLSDRELLEAWVQRGRPRAELAAVLELAAVPEAVPELEAEAKISPRFTNTQLLEWLAGWQQIRRHFP